MALLTDGNPNDDDALRVYESEIFSLANVENINLNVKLRLATEEISFDVLNILLDHAPTTDPIGTVRRARGASDVVVTPQMRRWHALTLAIVYRDAYNNQLNDRYQVKWDEYRGLAREARDQTLHYGIGLVATPVPRAVAPSFSVAAGPIVSTTYYVRVSWLSASGQEGIPSRVTTYQTPDGSLLVVGAISPPPIATSWNMYAGLSEMDCTLQNSTPIPVGQPFTMPATGLVVGVPAGYGQSPDTWIMGGRTLLRG